VNFIAALAVFAATPWGKKYVRNSFFPDWYDEAFCKEPKLGVFEGFYGDT
jgi:hypothetical protein